MPIDPHAPGVGALWMTYSRYCITSRICGETAASFALKYDIVLY